MNERVSTLLQIQENFTHLGAGAKAVAEQTRAATMAICFIILDARGPSQRVERKTNYCSRTYGMYGPYCTYLYVLFNTFQLGFCGAQYTFYIN